MLPEFLPFTAPVNLSFPFRWAMELVTVDEAIHYEDNMRNVIIMMFKVGD